MGARRRPAAWALALALALPAGAAAGPPAAAERLDTAWKEPPTPTVVSSPDPERRVAAGWEELAGRAPQVGQARAIGESLIRDFPGTIHALAGLKLLLRATQGAAEEAALAELEALEARLGEIVAGAIAPTPDFATEAAELWREIVWSRGMLLVERGRRGDPEGFRAAARIFLEIAERLGPDHARTPVARFNAGQCRLAAGDPAAARSLFEALVDRHPASELAERALMELVDLARALGRFEEAAGWMELHAERYPRTLAARGHVREAVAIRVGLGQAEAARADLDLAARIFVRGDRRELAELEWSLVELADTDAERRARVEAHRRRFGRAPLDRWIVAEASLAAEAWRGACAGTTTSELCVGPPPDRRAAAGRRCSPPRTPRVLPRAAAPAEAAQRRLEALDGLLRIRRVEVPWERRRAFADAIAIVRVAILDRDLEALLAEELPADLRLAVDPAATGAARQRQLADRDRSRSRLEAFLADREVRAGALEREYAAIRRLQSARGTFAALYRRGLIAEHLGDRLASAANPTGIAGGPAADAHCDALREAAAPLREEAIEAYRYCLDKALDYQVDDPSVRACEAALARLDPPRHPATVEFVGEAAPIGALAPRRVGVQFEAPAMDAGGEATASSSVTAPPGRVGG